MNGLWDVKGRIHTKINMNLQFKSFQGLESLDFNATFNTVTGSVRKHCAKLVQIIFKKSDYFASIGNHESE